MSKKITVVVVKNLEMPDQCWYCPMCNDISFSNEETEYYCSALDSAPKMTKEEIYANSRPDFCPLTEVTVEISGDNIDWSDFDE